MKDFSDFQSAIIGLRNGANDIQVVSDSEDPELDLFLNDLRGNSSCKVVECFTK